MAITYTLKEIGQTASPGQDGAVLCRIILDGSLTSKAITLPATHHIKTIKGVIGAVTVASNGIGNGVAGTTGFTATFSAGTNEHALDVLIVGSGT